MARRSRRVTKRETSINLSSNQILDAAADSMFRTGTLEDFWLFLKEARKLGMVKMSEEGTKRLIEDNWWQIEKRSDKLEDDIGFEPFKSKEGLKSSRRGPDDPRREGPVWGQ